MRKENRAGLIIMYCRNVWHINVVGWEEPGRGSEKSSGFHRDEPG